MYQSPYRLAGISTPAISPKELQLARRKMLAELELSGGMSLEVNGRSWNRQEITAFFDGLNNEQSLQLHALLLEDAALLDFLETGRITERPWTERPHYELADFRQFVSPYYAAAVDQLVKQVLDGAANEKDYTSLFDRPQFLQMQDAAQAFAYALRFYYRRKADAQQMAGRMERNPVAGYTERFDPLILADTRTYRTDERLRPQDIIEWREGAHIPLLNQLPDEYFGELRYQIASDLNDLCVIADQGNHSIPAGYEALLTAARINCGTELQGIIRGNIEVFKGKMNQGIDRKTGGVKQEDSKFTWSWVGIIIFILIRLLLGAGSCN